MKKFIIAGIAIVAFIALLILNPIVMISSGHRGVVTSFGKVTGDVLDEGIHLIVPIFNSVTEMSVRTEKLQTSTIAYSKDIQTVDVEIALNFNTNPLLVADLYQQVRQDFVNVLITPAIQESVKAAVANFTAQELIEKRPLVKDEIKAALSERLKTYFIVTDFSITNFDFNDQFEKAVEEKQVAQQNALKAENDLRRIEVEAKQVIEKAKAEAESIRIQGQALSQNNGLVELKAVEKWNGILPQYMLGESVPFLSLPQGR